MIKRDINYYGMTTVLDGLFKKSLKKESHNHLMRLITSKKNILLAIKKVSRNNGRNSKGLDMPTFDSFLEMNEKDIISLVRSTINWRQPIKNKIKYFPEKNGKRRKLGIGSILDRVAQQCCLNILDPILEAQFSNNSFGFRKNCSPKHAFAVAASWLWKSKRNFWVLNIDFENYFESISIDLVLDKLRNNFGVKDPRLLSTIKRMLWRNSNNGIGIPAGSVLGPSLANVMLDDLDKLFESLQSQIPEGKCKNMWKQIDLGKWDSVRNGVPYIRFSRYADDIKIISSSKKQIEEIIGIIEDWCSENRILINKEKTSFYCISDRNVIEMCGFQCKKTRTGLIISPVNQNSVLNSLKEKYRQCKKNGNPSRLIASFILLMNYFDICTNNVWLINFIERVLNPTKRGGFKIENSRRIDKDGHRFYTIKASNRDNSILFSPWIVRRQSKQSISNYLERPFIKGYENYLNRVDCCEFINNSDNDYNGKLIMYLPGLLHRQHFKCYVSGKELSPGYFDIHHKLPSSKGGGDEFKNLVLLSRDVHRFLHSLKSGEVNPYENLSRYQELKNLIIS